MCSRMRREAAAASASSAPNHCAEAHSSNRPTSVNPSVTPKRIERSLAAWVQTTTGSPESASADPSRAPLHKPLRCTCILDVVADRKIPGTVLDQLPETSAREEAMPSRLAAGLHEIAIDGVRQPYRVAGQGPVCVLHPGGPGATAGYLRMPEVEEHLTCVYVEPVGTGDSGRLPDPDGYTVDTYVRFLHAVVEHLDQPSVYLLGHSYGGFVAQTYAARHSDRLTGIILYDTAAVAGPELMTAAAGNAEQWAEDHREHEDAAEVLKAFKTFAEASSDEERVLRHRAFYPLYLADYWGDLDKYRSLQQARHLWTVSSGSAPPFNGRPLLAEIKLPTLVIAGRHDFICGTNWAAELVAGIAGARGVTLEHSGHFGHVEEPDAFAHAVLQFAGIAH